MNMDIDEQGIAAVHMLKPLGYSYRNDAWLPPTATAAPPLALDG
jgi:hypothetical protein